MTVFSFFSNGPEQEEGPQLNEDLNTQQRQQQLQQQQQEDDSNQNDDESIQETTNSGIFPLNEDLDVIWDSPTRGRLQRRRRRRHPPPTDTPDFKVRIPPAICDFVAFFFEWTQAALEVWVELLTAPPFPTATLQKVSIILLGMEQLREYVEQSLTNKGGALMLVFTTSQSEEIGGEEAWTLYSIPKYLIFGLPAVIALMSVSFVITLQLTWGHQEEAVIATALISLIFLEALLPLFILGCTSMFFFQQVSWETGLAMLVAVWLGSTFCAHVIRRMLYQSLGHG